MPSSLSLPPCSQLHDLLDQRLQYPERIAEIDQKITNSFEKECAVFVLDMSGFSSVVQRYGIIHFLAMVQRMRSVVRPCVERYGGTVVKFEADNCFAVFGDVDQALAAMKDVRHELGVFNDQTPDESDVHVSIGIGFGKILLFCDDLYGDQLNLASKLGEDVAEKNETLLTEAAHARVKNVASEILPVTISGVKINAHRV
ncbi:MAG: adenylate/guanylate cyclase domain-containing protein [Patescibacteria group bacterium]